MKYNYLIFLCLSWFFFWIANLIKPTATFDFFESTIVLSILNIWILIAIGMILFVIWLLAYLKFRWFDRVVSPKYAFSFMWIWFIFSIFEVIWKFVKDKFKIIYLLTFITSFVLTLFFTKWFFGVLQNYYDHNLDLKAWKVLSSLIMWDKLPTKPRQELTWSLYSWLKEVIWSSYNEDNGRYEGYGNKDFGNVWWSFIVPDKWKTTYCVYFNKNLFNSKDKNFTCEEKIDWLSTNNKIVDNILNKIAIDIFDHKDEDLFKKWIWNIIEQQKDDKLQDLAKQLNIKYENTPAWVLKKDIFNKLEENTEKQLLKQIKDNLSNHKFDINNYSWIFQTNYNKKLLNQLLSKPYIYTYVSIPYKYIVLFNVTFNWSLQNLSSYYTDIWIVWLLLFFILKISILFSVVWLIYAFFVKNNKLFKYFILLFSFSFATLVGWTIWYFVASGIVWYNIWGIIWLILTTLLFVSRLENKMFLSYVLLFVSWVSVILNLFRIASQWWWQIQTWYRSSVWQKIDYIVSKENWQLTPKQIIKIPYTFDDVFNLQFRMYNKSIKAYNDRTSDQMAIIGWTYMKYFIKNQNKIKDDQFLMWLWKMWSDNDIEKTYQRFKDNWLKYITIDPNIASVVMWTWNISLWYRYYWKTDENSNITEKWVLPMFVDLAEKWYLVYRYTNNLWLKYALIYSDSELSKILWEKDLSKIRKIRYELTSIRYLYRNIPLWLWNTGNTQLWFQAYQEAIDSLYKILLYRIQNNPIWFVEDIADVDWLDVSNIPVVIQKWMSWLSNLNIDEFNNLDEKSKELILHVFNILQWLKDWPTNAQSIIRDIIEKSIWWRAQLLFVEIK